MKILQTSIAALVIAVTVPAANAAVSFTPGDILVGFRATGGTGAGSNYVFNLGPGVTYRDNSNVGFVFNIGVDLASLYGADWFGRTDLVWSIAGVRDNSAFGGTVVNGDPARAVYVSRTTTAPGASTPWNLGTASAVTQGANNMIATQNGFQLNGTIPRDATPNSGNRGVIQGVGDINSWAAITDPSNPFGVFTPAVKGTFGTGNPFAYLDLYRILAANPTGTVEPQTIAQGVYQTTFTIDNQGNINAIPEPSSAMLAGLAGLAAFARRRRKSVA
jgi:hypothetical protein